MNIKINKCQKMSKSGHGPGVFELKIEDPEDKQQCAAPGGMSHHYILERPEMVKLKELIEENLA